MQNDSCQKCVLIKCTNLTLPKFAISEIAKMSLVKIAHLLNWQNYSCQSAYLVKTQKRQCQNLRYIKRAKNVIVKICTFSKYKK